jgi:hypothetical protein
MRDNHEGSCTPVLFEAYDYCQLVNRTWNPRSGPYGMPLILNDLVRDPSPLMELVVQTAMGLPGSRNWGPRPESLTVWACPLPGPERWLPQLKPENRARRSRNRQA